MEEGGKPKKTIFVGGIGEDIDEKVIMETFSTFGALVGNCSPLTVIDF
jgi:peptidyl-prolyl isomerase E (cyclophilin E)